MIIPTVATDSEVRSTLSLMHERMIEVADALSPREARIVYDFMEQMRGAVEKIDPPQG